MLFLPTIIGAITDSQVLEPDQFIPNQGVHHGNSSFRLQAVFSFRYTASTQLDVLQFLVPPQRSANSVHMADPIVA